MNISEIMRQYMSMLEDALDPKKIDSTLNTLGSDEEDSGDIFTGRNADGRADHPDISFTSVSADKVVAQLQSYKSGRYTKLAQRVQAIATQEAEIKQLKEQVKDDTRMLIADLFAADDAARTRVVETMSFIMTLSKDPKPSQTFKYAEILKELEEHLTPELLAVLKAIKAKYEGETKKSPSLKIAARTESVDLSESPMDTLKAFYAKFKNVIMNWAHKYDAQLESLKQAAGV